MGNCIQQQIKYLFIIPIWVLWENMNFWIWNMEKGQTFSTTANHDAASLVLTHTLCIFACIRSWFYIYISELGVYFSLVAGWAGVVDSEITDVTRHTYIRACSFWCWFIYQKGYSCLVNFPPLIRIILNEWILK